MDFVATNLPIILLFLFGMGLLIVEAFMPGFGAPGITGVILEVITLVDKPSCRMVDFKPDMALFETEDCFVIGCGMDCSEYYRNLPYLAEYDRG